MSIYKSFAIDVTSAKKLLEAYPPAVLAALNLKVEIFFTIYGFFAYLLTFAWLTGAIQAMNLGVSVLSKEVAGKTADFLLTKPVTRVRMVTEKLAAVFTLVVITNIFFLATALLSAAVFSKNSVDFSLFSLIAVTLFFIQIFFLALGFVLGAIIPKVKTVVAVTLPVVFAFFIISAFGGVLKIANINYFTPFKYFDPVYIYQHSSYEPKYLLVLFGVVTVCIITSYVFYMKKDIEAAS
jgi:ABC-2 type transport system permease protein